MVLPSQPRKPLWYAVPARVLLITFILTLLSFAVCLLLAILGVAIAGLFHGASPDMRIAYRHIALPAAKIAAAVVLIASTVIEVRHYRQARTLAGIARASH